MVKLFVKYSLGSVISALISLFTTPVITALILPQEMGKASMYTLAVGLGLQIILLGTDQSYVRHYYKHTDKREQRRLLNSCMLPPLLLFAIACPLLFLFQSTIAPLLVNDNTSGIIVLISISLLLGILERFATVLLRLEKKAAVFSFVKLAGSVVNFVVVYYYATHIHKDFYALIYGNIGALLLSFLVAYAATFREWTLDFGAIRTWKNMLAYGLPFVPAFLAAWVFEGVDKLALRKYAGFTELGLFSASFKFVAILSILQMAFTTFWAPLSMELYETQSDAAKSKFAAVFALGSGALFLGGLCLITSTDLVMLLFDKNYDKSGTIMPFLLLIPIMYTLSEITVGGINFKNKTYWHTVIAVISGGSNVLLCYLLVPAYGARGAAISTGICYIIFFIARTVISQHYYKIRIHVAQLAVTLLIFMAVCFLNTFDRWNKGIIYAADIAAIIAVFLMYFKSFRRDWKLVIR